MDATGSRQAIAASSFTIFIGFFIRLNARDLLLGRALGGAVEEIREGEDRGLIWF